MSLFSIKKKTLKLIYKNTFNIKLRCLLLRMMSYHIGNDVYLPANLLVSDIGSRKNNLEIGNRVSIGPSVILVTDSSPNNSKLLGIYPLISGKIIIEDDVWLGAGVIILPNVKIGNFSIIASGSVVTKNIPSNCVYGGVPAKFIKKINNV